MVGAGDAAAAAAAAAGAANARRSLEGEARHDSQLPPWWCGGQHGGAAPLGSRGGHRQSEDVWLLMTNVSGE